MPSSMASFAEVGRRERGERGDEQEAERERDARLVRRGEPRECGKAAARAAPRVAGRGRLTALDGEVGAGLPDPHAVPPRVARLRLAPVGETLFPPRTPFSPAAGFPPAGEAGNLPVSRTLPHA